MPSYLPEHPSGEFVFDFAAVKDLGKDHADAYRSGEPFPHIVIDNFLPESIVDYCISHFPTALDPEGREFNRAQERYKKSFQPDYLEPKLRLLFYTFNSRPFIKVIENITGIRGLIPDPYFLGGGFHEIATGGHLSMHADFNHHRPMNLERRVNVLVYLNPDWKAEYGGQLELWTPDMQRQVHAIVPIANRCAIFTTTSDSMHGNPTPVAHPEGTPRRSIALYYYTATWSEDHVQTNTQFRQRAGTEDAIDWGVRFREFCTEYLPPAVTRRLVGLANRISERGN